MSKPKVILVGPLPPPYMGPSLATEILLGSRLGEIFDLIHLDTSHHKDLSTLGKVGLPNILSALRHYYACISLLLIARPELVYIPISQTTVGYLRDSVFILLGRLFRKKVICHLRGGNFRHWFEGVSPVMRRYVRRVHAMVDVQIVLGEKLRPLFEGLVPDNRIHVVPNGRDFTWDSGDIYRDNPHRVRILFLSNFVKTKGVLEVLRAIPGVIGKCADAEFVFAGAWYDEDVRREMLGMVKDNPGYPIEIAGKVSGSRKLDLLRSADIFVFPTYYPPEGHPWAIVEAMAAGLPVISTDQGAITESVHDGVNGYIVEKGSPAAVAESIVGLCRNRELLKRMGAESRRLYEREYTEGRMVERMQQAFNAALGRPPAAAE